MISRFQIEEHVAQDAGGVVFRAHDSETDQSVALRRFFPYGAEGGGLSGEDQVAYEAAVRRLAEIDHPALRRVIAGGCDPVDGMPYLATEWIEGETLEEVLVPGPLPLDEAVEVMTRAFEVSEILSRHFGEEAIWVDTRVSEVVVDQTGDRGATFWISARRWLGASGGIGNLEPITNLGRDVLGWRNKLVPDTAGSGLAGWLKWIKTNSDTLTLADARRSLEAFPAPGVKARVASPVATPVPAASATPTRRASPTRSVSTQPPAPTRPATAPGQKVATAAKSGPTLVSVVIKIFVLLLAIGGLAVIVTHPKLALANRLLGKKADPATPASETPAPPGQTTAAAGQEEISGAYFPGDHALLREREGKLTQIEGVLERIRPSKTGKTLFLEFSEAPPPEDACGFVNVESAPPDLSENALKTLLGKRVRLKGILEIEPKNRAKRPQILITTRASIEIQE